MRDCRRLEGRFRLPAEWERHARTWLAWPHNRETWPGCLEEAESAWKAIAAAVRPGEKVAVLARDGRTVERLQVLERSGELGGGHPVEVHLVPTNDAWIRDYGPLVVCGESSPRIATVWRFNAWGGKYPPWDSDAQAGRRVAELMGVDQVECDWVLEGGSIESDGCGTLLTTESCLLDPNRNAGADRDTVEDILRSAFGVRRVIWLYGGLEGDDTDGHVDNLARFVRPGTVLAAWEDDPRDPNHEPLRENLQRLRRARDAMGRELEVVPVPMPGPVVRNGMRLPASYLNFYIANAAVLVPVFGDDRDRPALERIAGAFKDRRVVPIDARALVVGLGGVHCVTLQEPWGPDTV